jgi:hypothetical protein
MSEACSRSARANGVKTEYGCPLRVRSEPGARSVSPSNRSKRTPRAAAMRHDAVDREPLRERRNDLRALAGDDQEPRAEAFEVRRELGQRFEEELDPVRHFPCALRSEEERVQDEERNELRSAQGFPERPVVRNAEVLAPEPDERPHQDLLWGLPPVRQDVALPRSYPPSLGWMKTS